MLATWWLSHRYRRHHVHAIRAKNKSEHICKSSRPCSNMHRAIDKSAKPLGDMCIIRVCELLQCTNRIARDVQRSSKRYVIPINKRMHCILICFSCLLVHMFSSEYVYVVVFIQQKRFEAELMWSIGTHFVPDCTKTSASQGIFQRRWHVKCGCENQRHAYT